MILGLCVLESLECCLLAFINTIFFTLKDDANVELQEEMNIGEFVDESLAIKPLENDANDANDGVSKFPESFPQSTLTESQHLRMEENNRKALEKRNQNVSPKNKSLTKEQLSRMKENKEKALEKRSQIQKNVSSQIAPSMISGVDNESKRFKFKKREKNLEELCDENDLSWSSDPKFELGEPKERKSNPGNTKSL